MSFTVSSSPSLSAAPAPGSRRGGSGTDAYNNMAAHSSSHPPPPGYNTATSSSHHSFSHNVGGCVPHPAQRVSPPLQTPPLSAGASSLATSSGGGSANVSATGGPAPAYISPALLPQAAASRGAPPPFSLHSNTTTTTTSAREAVAHNGDGAYSSLGYSTAASMMEHHAAGARPPRGTDPTKYKTTMCRNWEQNGSCSFRGCAFAHGMDDLRPPARGGSSSGISPILESATTPRGGPSSHTAGGASSVTSTLTLPPAVGCTSRYEALVEHLNFEMSRQREQMFALQDANRVLEGKIRRERELGHEANDRIAALTNAVAHLEAEIARVDGNIAASKQSKRMTPASVAGQPPAHRHSDAQPPGGGREGQTAADDERVKDILASLNLGGA